jgi:hypothetical protein
LEEDVDLSGMESGDRIAWHRNFLLHRAQGWVW